MSYALINPPPTAGPLPVVDSASLGAPYYAPASGGGGGGGVNPAGISTNAVAAATGTKLSLFAGTTATSIALDSAADNIVLNAATVDATGANLIISSINGAAPGGGGVGPNPLFSSISLSTNAAINFNSMNFVGSGASLGINIFNQITAAVNDIQLATNVPGSIVNPSLTGNVNYINMFAPAANSGITLVSGDNEGQFLIGGIAASGASTFTILNPGDVVFTAPNTSISTLTVSSINGTAPALTSYSVQDVGGLFSSLFAANPALSTIVF